MNCRWMRNNLGAYHDGELSSAKRLAARLHLSACSRCFAESERLEDLSPLAATLSPVRPPANLNMRLRLAVYREMARETWARRTLRAIRAGLIDGMRPLAIRTGGGLLAALLLFGVVMPDLWTVRAASRHDVPLTYLAKGFVNPPAMAMLAPNGIQENVTVVVYIDMRGQVYDLEVLNHSGDNRLHLQIANTLLFSEFEPATNFGLPVAGRLLITFTYYTVNG